MKFFRNTLRNRLMASFMLIVLISVLLSTYVVVRVNTSRLGKQMEEAVVEASRKTLETIGDYQEHSALISQLILQDRALVRSLLQRESFTPVQTGNPLILWFPGDNEDLPRGRDIIRIDGHEALVSGVVEPVADEEGRHAGCVLVGYELGKGFSQEMSRFTDVEISIWYRRDSDAEPDEKEKEMEKHFSKGQPYYERHAKFQDTEYMAYYHPIITSAGEVAGIIFAGIPMSYGFSEIVGTWSFFPILTAVALLMAGGLGYTMAQFISRPIMVFKNGVQAVARGDLDQEINIEATEELSDLSRAFNRMTRKLRELRRMEKELSRKDRLAALGELSAGVAHEVRNPLGIIKSSAQMLARVGPDREKTGELTGFIVDETERLDRVITNFLDFARPREMNSDYILLPDVLRQTLKLCRPGLKKSGIRVIENFGGGEPGIYADEELIKQAFLNLFINAVDAMPDGGEITVSLGMSGREPGGEKRTEITVSDTGPGIHPDAAQKIFNPFFSTKENGSGLGLSIVHKIIESHGGEISVYSEQNRGTSFKISLPAEQK